MSILEFSNLKYAYNGKQSVLRGASGKLEQGKLYAILGPSGCGKTTLLSLLGGLDSPESGQILFAGKDIAETGLANHRRNHVSFIFQSYNTAFYFPPILLAIWNELLIISHTSAMGNFFSPAARMNLLICSASLRVV